MKITFCDVCFKTKKIYIKSTYRIWYNGKYSRIKLDVCNDHKDFFKDCKTYHIAEKKVWQMNKEIKK